MDIAYATRSQFLDICEIAIKEHRTKLDAGDAIRIILREGGYNGKVSITINPDDQSSFSTDWERTDPTRFPARIKAAATALRDCGCDGKFEINHSDGLLKIRSISGTSIHMHRVFGHIEGINVGEIFPNRRVLSEYKVHKPTQAGISGSESEGADSIVLSGGYEDDRDYGDVIIYTGHGGRNPLSGHQVEDQKMKRGNLALARNITTGLPVRVVRGPDQTSSFSPAEGYRYDGLYRVCDAWSEKGKSGLLVWRFRLEAVDTQPGHDSTTENKQRPQPRVSQTVQRIVRDTVLSRKVKKLHGFSCQVCGTRLEGPAGPYAEAAHIRPLGEPHNGPDIPGNLLCLCPNHHVLFDLGAITINDDLSLNGEIGLLRTIPEHTINIAYIQYHREHYGAR